MKRYYVIERVNKGKRIGKRQRREEGRQGKRENEGWWR